MPQEVAVQIASSGFNSPTEKLTDFRSVSTPEGLAWTAFRTPDGAFRIFSKKSQGIVTLNAESTERRVKPTDAELEVAPGQLLTDNLRWRLLKRHYLIDLANPVGALDREGRPIIIVPYVSYKGWLIRRPVLGGVFVVHPDGEIEDLSPDEARKRPEITSTGRLFPDTLARRIQDAYAYKRGIWNRFVLHEEQTQISDTESNQQPYLIDFGERGAKWVTVAEPYGQAFAANAIFLTDTVTGKTEIWRVPRNASLSGNRRAVQTVRSVSIPGVVFAGEGAQGTGGRFKVVEPRPVFVRGRLLYLRVGHPGERQLGVEERDRRCRAQQGGGDLRQRHGPIRRRGHPALPVDRRARSGRRAAAGVRKQGGAGQPATQAPQAAVGSASKKRRATFNGAWTG